MNVYQTRNHRLVLEDGKEIELTNNEHKFLLGLSSGNLITFEELSKLIYGYISKTHVNLFNTMKYSIEKKTGFKIKNIPGRGYLLKDDTAIYYI